jgi:hypothetical protein
MKYSETDGKEDAATSFQRQPQRNTGLLKTKTETLRASKQRHQSVLLNGIKVGHVQVKNSFDAEEAFVTIDVDDFLVQLALHEELPDALTFRLPMKLDLNQRLSIRSVREFPK